MDIFEAVRSRMSIRSFRPDPVEKSVLKEIIETACQSPSAMNTQPWEFVVVTGEPLEEIKAENCRRFRAGEKPGSEHEVIGWPKESVYRERQVELAKGLFSVMEIRREEKEKRQEWMERGFGFFGAPAAIFLLTDRSLTETGPLLDLGAAMQTLCLAALPLGLGTCIEDQGVMYPDGVRRIAGIPEEKRIIISVAIGYPDESFPANRFRSHREPAESLTRWIGF